MNLTHVLAFHRVAAAGSFTLAARMSGVSQPTLSAQVRALERSAGIALFERSGRRIRLTAAGQALVAATNRLEEVLGEVDRVLRGTRSALRGGLRVSADSAVHVLPVLAELKRQSSSFNFSIRIDNSAEVTAHVLNDEADVGVMASASTDPRLFSVKIRHDRLVLLVSARDALARRRSVRIADLKGRDLVVRERGSITREALEERLTRDRIATGQVFDVATREAVREAVAAGFGVGVVFSSEAGKDARLRALAISDADVALAEYAICRIERRSLGLVARFLDTAQQLALESGWLAEPRREAGVPYGQKA
ncbi:MAG TPA: LysR substrate-binding domain-containing protein [Hyphomicrobiaceae bacterium]|nr:LysR substrate-binding domain-containing protein [Hyphomicrobiaceae bacterium]